jgi:CheY-like chemotaxis protein
MTSPILVVSPQGEAALFPETVLDRRSALVAVSHTGSTALETIQNGEIRLAIFSEDLGDMTAAEFCRQVRGDESTRSTSLLFVGDRKDGTQMIDLCMSFGCNDVVLRPFTPQEFDAKVQRLMRIPLRRELRTLTRVEVSSEREGHVILGHSVNISASGMLLEIDRVLPPEARVRLHFYLHGERAPIRPLASVIRADFSGGFPRYGMRFDDIDDSSRDRIIRFVVRMRSREAL